MWTRENNQGYSNEDNYLQLLKKDSSYNFSYYFEYISKNYGNDIYDIESTSMEVNVNWSDAQLGYVISFSVPEMYKVDPCQGNGSDVEFFENDVYWKLISDLESMGIGAEAIVSF